ncbi:unnamed protein product, partial [Symbiodinium sp. KB8]
ACCDDGYGVIVLADDGEGLEETQLVEPSELDAKASMLAKKEEIEDIDKAVDETGPEALRATLALFDDDEEIPVVSRVSQFENRDSRKRKSKKADDAGDDKEPAQPLPTTPKTGTSTPEPATKKDHEEAKKLLRSERLHGADQTRRYLFEERIFESEPEARPGLDKGEEQKGSEEDGK